MKIHVFLIVDISCSIQVRNYVPAFICLTSIPLFGPLIIDGSDLLKDRNRIFASTSTKEQEKRPGTIKMSGFQ